MMKRTILTVVTMTGLFCAGLVTAGEPVSRMDCALQQLGRGLGNVASGLLEIPLNIHAVQQEQGDMAAISYGTVRGLWRFGVREVVGVFEILTFPAGLEPIVYPEYIGEEGPVGVLLEPERSTAMTPYPEWKVVAPKLNKPAK